jgi:hypothetical protein
VQSRPALSRQALVSHDWRQPLSENKSRAYHQCIRRLETAYGMFSVNFDEALGMRRRGRDSKACQVLSVAPALCDRLAHLLRCLLGVMLDYSKHFGIAPNLVALDAQNFQNSRSQRVALFNDLLTRVLLTRKSQFVHKISALADLVDDLYSSFESTAEALASGESLRPGDDWKLLDCVHYDLNTCLRETVVLYKSFLHALPEQQLADFLAALDDEIVCASSPLAARAHHLAHRRIAFLKGQ